MNELSSAAVALARGELAQRRDTGDVTITEKRYLERCSLKTAGCSSRPAGSAASPRTRPGPRSWPPSGARSASPSSCWTTCSTSPGPPERTGKARGTDLLDGTVTLPLILARRSDPELARAELAGLDAAAAEALCDRIAATGVLDEVRARARAGIESAKARLGRRRLQPRGAEPAGPDRRRGRRALLLGARSRAGHHQAARYLPGASDPKGWRSRT